ncbi:GDP-L-fucose synthase family protein [Pseudomonas lurida]|jgi:GDP-L-fucose synthase|uniref:GDP-L-fucose synthase n=3 Tax=Pseudomonas TaxID=286 RepID=A0A5E6MKT9_PSEFL|nr:GDP-L-fucose synthase [Pseudomonas lurida]VVM11850.1 GDP-L-colitose synthase [Pseudomonas fluorescens]MBC8982177.1 GDP-L-fucose synthase [Pseudomonas lurida]MCF5025837.1 NAD-dependent epimerase/dehydratase family protein [Pseudomonas lurida]MCF5311222.1 NAD-dependent epimerase/dehydratase family protein [Pseudomonas lurida]WLH08886.1 GDP-L-fucose synthase [Pseudomonas lurida]
MKKIRILLTGGSGMVGRNLLEHSCIDDFEVLAPPSSELNLLDFKAVQDYVERTQPNVIIHAAGKVGGIQANIREPVKFLLDNLDMGRNIVWAARTAGVKRLINLGSSCMYPRNHSEPLSEDMVLTGELEPTNEGYALAKITTARLCEYITREDASFNYKTLVPCNIFGRFDKFEPAHSHLLPAIIHKIHLAKINDNPTVEIWGDGNARREFMYGGDLADAIMQAVDKFDSLPLNMNIGQGHDHSINEYYHVAAAVMDYKGQFIHDMTKPVGMARKLVSIERQSLWGWKPRHTLQEGIEKTYSYYLEHQQ